jgi:Mg-chelatase subunit ChlD
MEYSIGPEDMVERIWKILKKEENKKVDLVICLDVTGSMKPYFDAIRQQLIPNLKEIVAGYESFRIGMVFFKDYNDEFLTRVFPFTVDFNLLQRNVDTVKVGGGGDIPEAVFEALYDGATKLSWGAESKIMILIGDAPPHPNPRGKITKQMMDKEVSQRDIRLHAIILPQQHKAD